VEDQDDRWKAALALWEVELNGPDRRAGGWSLSGALPLAALLPESLGDFRDDLQTGFTDLRSDSDRLPEP
jgi:hypothetical protein